jgi:hypothetical protein
VWTFIRENTDAVLESKSFFRLPLSTLKVETR